MKESERVQRGEKQLKMQFSSSAAHHHLYLSISAGEYYKLTVCTLEAAIHL